MLHPGSGASGFGCSSELLPSGSGVRVHVCMCACVQMSMCACVNVWQMRFLLLIIGYKCVLWSGVHISEYSRPYSFMALTLPRHHSSGLPQHTATLCNILQPCPQDTATQHCNTLQHCTSHRDSLMLLTLDITCCNVLQCVAMCCSVLQCIASSNPSISSCSLLQSVAVHCMLLTLNIT